MAMTHKAMLAQVLAAQDASDVGLQDLIDAGAWRFEGSIGRSMMAAIEAGFCVLGPEHAYDYWGNRIPSRHEVQSGTKGSVLYAWNALQQREDWS